MPHLLPAAGVLLLTAGSASAYPQYAEWISKKAGFQANCAYCHINRDGPTGSGAGQTGSLTKQELARLHTPDSPIVNDFGKSLIAHLGYARIVQGITDPDSVARELRSYDLDGDGITDGAEMQHGTLADDPTSAPPSLIWWVRLQRNMGFVATVAIASVVGAIGCFGLARALKRQ
ncbi:MAG TPA: thrombospondin type 3 repeat-containing protein [Candidatus Obscuribacterales bacterium]